MVILNAKLTPAVGAVVRKALEAAVDKQVLESPENEGQSLLENGTGVSAETSRRVVCDSSKVVMVHGKDGQVLNVGRKTRVIPAAIRRALLARDKRCRFPGCPTPLMFRRNQASSRPRRS
jgi:hypothetical protein